MDEMISKVIPILLLIFFGYVIQKRKIIKISTMDEIKKMVINMMLPSVLFITFLDMNLKKEYFLVNVIIFILLSSFFSIGFAINKIKKISHPLLPFVVSGSAFGLLGIPLYAAIFGSENLDKISILGIGHELFIWVIFFNVLKIKFNGEKFSLKGIKGFLKSPIIFSIILGIAFNTLGVANVFHEGIFLKGIYGTMEYLASLATPLILIIIGFGLKFNKKYMRQSIKFIIIRYIIIFTLGYIFKYLFIDHIILQDPLFNYAYFTFLILPIPFSLAIFVSEYSTLEHSELINNTIVLNTVLTIITYIGFIFFV